MLFKSVYFSANGFVTVCFQGENYLALLAYGMDFTARALLYVIADLVKALGLGMGNKTGYVVFTLLRNLLRWLGFSHCLTLGLAGN